MRERENTETREGEVDRNHLSVVEVSQAVAFDEDNGFIDYPAQKLDLQSSISAFDILANPIIRLQRKLLLVSFRFHR